MVKEDIKLTEEKQEMLINFLKTIMRDSKSISIKSDRSQYQLYKEIVDNMDELHLFYVREDWSKTSGTWEVTLEFLYPLRELIE